MSKFDPKRYFAHKQAIKKRNQRFFTGRRSDLADALDNLGVPGAAGIIFGERGVGKTSFAWQLMELMGGNYSLLKRLDIKPVLHLDEHICFWIQCRKNMIDLYGALLALLRRGQISDRSIARVYPKIFSGKHTSAVKRIYKFGLPIASATLEFSDTEGNAGFPHNLPQDLILKLGTRAAQIEDLFFEILGLVKEDSGDKEIVFFFDEFDRLLINKGAGEFIQACNDAKIVVVGVADQIDQIIQDHESCARKLIGTKFFIPNLNRIETHQLFENTARLAKKDKFEIEFSPDFVDVVFGSSDGYPHHVQLLGYAALYSKLKSGQDFPLKVERHDFDEALNVMLKDPNAELDSYDKIRKAIGDSINRAKILLRMAQHEAGWMQERFVKSVLSSAAGQLHLETHLDRLEAPGVIKRDPNTNRIKFSTPELRSIVRLAGDSRLMSDL